MAIHNDKFQKGSNLESKLEIKKLIRSCEFETSRASAFWTILASVQKTCKWEPMAAGCYEESKMSEWVVSKKQSMFPRLDMSYRRVTFSSLNCKLSNSISHFRQVFNKARILFVPLWKVKWRIILRPRAKNMSSLRCQVCVNSQGLAKPGILQTCK